MAERINTAVYIALVEADKRLHLMLSSGRGNRWVGAEISPTKDGRADLLIHDEGQITGGYSVGSATKTVYLSQEK